MDCHRPLIYFLMFLFVWNLALRMLSIRGFPPSRWSWGYQEPIHAAAAATAADDAAQSPTCASFSRRVDFDSPIEAAGRSQHAALRTARRHGRQVRLAE